MKIPKWFVWALFHLPGVKVTQSKTVKMIELQKMVDRIMAERTLQWEYNHPTEEFPGIEDSELMREVERRVWLLK
jgi:hypothetical protein